VATTSKHLCSSIPLEAAPQARKRKSILAATLRQTLTTNESVTARIARAYKDCLSALDASSLSLRRDFWSGMGRRGDHAIHGKRGHIYPDGDGYLLCVGSQSARLWSAAKRKLSCCQLRIDGDDEGTLHLDHLPPPAEAKAIRQVMAIRKRRKPSGEVRRDLDGHFTPDISTVLAADIHFSG
jgi:hypothetical protein